MSSNSITTNTTLEPTMIEQLLQTVQDEFENAIKKLEIWKALAKPLKLEKLLDIRECDMDNYDFQLNICLKLFPIFRKKVPVAQLAKNILDKFNPSPTVVSKYGMSEKGFLMFSITFDAWNSLLNQNNLSKLIFPIDHPKKIAIDYSSPNIAKEMHVGHLRSTIIGDTLARIFEYVGHTVFRINHVGDWGTQFGMLIAYIKDLNLENLDELGELTKLYKLAKQKDKEDPTFHDRAKREVVLLQSGDPVNRSIWSRLCKASETMFSEIYQKMNISSKLEICGESFYQDKIDQMIHTDLANLVFEDETGAKIIKLSKKKSIVIQKSDGGNGYVATDLAAIRHRLVELNCDQVIYVVDAGQSSHFNSLFEIAKRAGWLTSDKLVQHCKFGLVCGSDGKRLRTSAGDSEPLNNLLVEGEKRAFHALEGKLKNDIDQLKQQLEEQSEVQATKSETNKLLQFMKFYKDKEDLHKKAEVLSISSIKYHDLSRTLKNNYIFNYDKMLDSKGDSALYLQYAYVRMMGILRNPKNPFSMNHLDQIIVAKKTDFRLTHETEVKLVIHLFSFQKSIMKILDTLEILPLTTYLRELSVRFTQFIHHCRVIGSGEFELTRLLLVYLSSKYILKGMELLGLNLVDKL